MPSKSKVGLKEKEAPASESPRRIGAVAAELGISASMIRAWERLGLRLTETPAGVHRSYSQQDVNLLRRAVYLRKVDGLNVPAIFDHLQSDGLLTHPSGRKAMANLPSVGRHLRKLRLGCKQSLADVAAVVGISTGFLSNLERSQTGVSLGIMHRLASHYQTSLNEILQQTDSPGPLVRKSDRRALPAGDGVRMELLAWGHIALEPHLIQVEPGRGSLEFYTHHGEEFLFIISGSLMITVGEQEFHLRAGDSFYFESKAQHRWHNPGKGSASLLWINTPRGSRASGSMNRI